MPIVFAALRYIPVSVSVVKVYEGSASVPKPALNPVLTAVETIVPSA